MKLTYKQLEILIGALEDKVSKLEDEAHHKEMEYNEVCASVYEKTHSEWDEEYKVGTAVARDAFMKACDDSQAVKELLNHIKNNIEI